jgi:chromosome segregation ATPase
LQSFKNDNEVILKQKIIHLNAEVKRLTGELEKHKDRTVLKRLEKEKLDCELESEELKSEIESHIEKHQELERNIQELHQQIERYQLELSKQKEESNKKIAALEEQFKHNEDRNQHLQNDLLYYQQELSKQNSINAELEKEYEMVKDTVKELIIKIEKSSTDQEGYRKIVEINEKLEQENLHYKKELEELGGELKNMKDENSLLVDDIKRLNECVGEWEAKADTFVHEATNVSRLKLGSNSSGEEKRIQSWFYNNIKKET